MASVNVSEIITRAQQAADMDDDFISQSTWLYWANVEYKKLWNRMARSGYPWAVVETSITITGALQYNTSEPVAIVGFRGATTTGKYFRIPIVHPANLTGANITITGVPKMVAVTHDPTNLGNELVIRFWPTPTSSTQGGITMLAIDKPKKLVLTAPGGDEATNVRLPNGFEERIVLGMARRALGKEETINPAIEAEIRDVDTFIDNSISSYLLRDQPTVHDVNEPTHGLLPPYTDWFYP